MDKPMPDLAFNLMSLSITVADFFRNDHAHVLDEAGIQPGSTVLDFGCGPGSYEPLLSQRVGVSGVVYALDIHPLAVRKVESLAREKGLHNVKPILYDGVIGLPAASVDIILMLDVFHMLKEPEAVLAELHRVLRPSGALVCAIHHMSIEKAASRIEATGLFNLTDRGGKTLRFVKK